MKASALQISWHSGIERVPIAAITKVGQSIETTEQWSSGEAPVRYTARVEAFSQESGNTSVRLRYVESVQKDPRVKDKKNDVCWGISELSWGGSQKMAKAKWSDDSDPSRSGLAKEVKIIGNESPVIKAARKTAAINRISRPDQGTLRDDVLLRDRCCVLTGEVEIAALEAAHVLPVDGTGADNVQNAILLRADIHCLYDQKLFSFTVSKSAAVVKCSKSLSPAYQKMLAGRQLPRDTFRDVEEALRLRASSPKAK